MSNVDLTCENNIASLDAENSHKLNYTINNNSKLIKSRQIQKHDIEANWLKTVDFIPANGELIIYNAEIDDLGNILELPAGRTEPYEYCRLKIGDGISNVNDLPFSSSQVIKSEAGSYILGDPLTDNLKALSEHGLISGTDSQIGIRGLKILSTSMDTITQIVSITTETIGTSTAEDLYNNEVGYVAGSTRAALVLAHHSFDFYKVESISRSIITVKPIIEGAENEPSFINLHRDNKKRNYLFLYNYNDTDEEGNTNPGSKAYDFSVNNNCPIRPEVDYIYNLGQLNDSPGGSAIALGFGNINTDWYGVALGRYNKTGYAAFAAGRNNEATGEYSSALNQFTKAKEVASLATGYQTEATAMYSAAHNLQTKANNMASTSFGINTTADREGQLAAGTYNKADTSAMFVVGNSTSNEDRKNAFVVKSNGTAELQDQGATKNSVVIKQTLDNTANDLDNKISNIKYGTINYFFTADKPTPDSTNNYVLTDNSIKSLTYIGAPYITISTSKDLDDFTLEFDLTTYGIRGEGWNGARPYILKNKSTDETIQMFDLSYSLDLMRFPDSVSLISFKRDRVMDQLEHIIFRCKYDESTNTTQVRMTLQNKSAGIDDTRTIMLNGRYVYYPKFQFEFASASLDNIILVEGDLDESKFNADREYVKEEILDTIKKDAIFNTAAGNPLRADGCSNIPAEMVAKLSSKNLLIYPFLTFGDYPSIGGLTFTKNADGTVVVDGTAISDATYYAQYSWMWRDQKISLPAGTYSLSGCPQSGSESTYYLNVSLHYVDSEVGPTDPPKVDYGNGVVFNAAKDFYPTIAINVKKGTTINNLIFKPQLEKGSNISPFVEYTSDISSKTVYEYGKNILNLDDIDSTTGKFVKNSDGSYTLTKLSDNERAVVFNAKLPAGRYYLRYSSGYNTDYFYADFIHGDGASDYTQIYLSSNIKEVILPKPVKQIRLTCSVAASNGTSIDFRDMQLEIANGSNATEYEPYKQVKTYVSDENGVIDNVISYAPCTTLLTDSNLATEYEYMRSFKDVIQELTNAIISLGGNI